LDILRAASADKLTVEVTLPGGRVYLATASPMVADDRPVGRVCILRDVTHFKELDTMKTEFVNTVSHDLRSPLTLMRGYATMLEMVGTLNEQQQSYVKKIIFGVENMARLVNTLLDLGRVEAGVGLQLEIAPLANIIEQVTGPLQLLAAQKNIELSVSIPKNAQPLIETDKALFQQAVYNLVENAIKYTPDGGHVVVRLQVSSDSMLLEVQDDGIGVDPADQPRLFEKFYRGGQREAREQRGSGLGLAIVKSIVEHHGGRVWLESQLGKGSTFFLQAPLRQPK
jgi:signal transduction histidine kinase